MESDKLQIEGLLYSKIANHKRINSRESKLKNSIKNTDEGAVKAVQLFDSYIKDIMSKSKGYQPSAVKHPVMHKRISIKPPITVYQKPVVVPSSDEKDQKSDEKSKKNIANTDLYEIDDF